MARNNGEHTGARAGFHGIKSIPMDTLDTSLKERVNQLVANEFELDPTAIQPDADLYKDLGLDSLDAIDLVVALERSFAFKVEEGAAKAVRTIAQLYEFVAMHL